MLIRSLMGLFNGVSVFFQISLFYEKFYTQQHQTYEIYFNMVDTFFGSKLTEIDYRQY